MSVFARVVFPFNETFSSERARSRVTVPNPLFDEIDHLAFQAHTVKRVDLLDAGGAGYVDLG